MHPLVSVIITTVNRENYLRETLSSILNQEYTSLEVIIVRDEILNRKDLNEILMHDSRVNVIEIEASGRPAVPRNVGMKIAKGKYIAFCDDDDLWDRHKISRQVSILEGDSKLLACGTGRDLIDENSILLSADSQAQNLVFDGSLSSFLYNSPFTFSSFMIRSEFLQKNNLSFNEDMKLKALEDFLFFVDILSQGHVHIINEPLVKYRIHLNGISNNKNSISKKLSYLTRVYRCFNLIYDKEQIGFWEKIKLKLFYTKNILKQIIYISLQKMGF